MLGGVPTRHIRYDNLKPAVRQVLFGRCRSESQRWVAFRSHYGFNAFYCLPGKAGAHEKGGVEHEGGRFRRNDLVPPPQVGSLAELNDRLSAIDAAEDDRHVHGSPGSIGFAFAEAPLLHPLPADDFDVGTTLTPTVRRNARIVIRQCYYSIPARFIARKAGVSLRANKLLLFDGRQVVARHPRLSRAGTTATTSTTTWRSSSPHPARRPDRLHWPRPAAKGRSPPNTTRSGHWPAPTTASPTAPACWSRSCCCADSCPTLPSSPESPRPSRQGPAARS
ncbi:hypothetical protein [Catellatospora sp. NPDC049609]|uniref:Mu transposase domain-containing protein n=1 Tax=Catellatospora sp. NPDC049609 TaxID=3155505 RepID=UPI003441BFA9